MRAGKRQAYFVEVSTDEGRGGAKDTITTLSHLFSVVGERGGARSTYGNHRVRGTLRNDDSQDFVTMGKAVRMYVTSTSQ